MSYIGPERRYRHPTIDRRGSTFPKDEYVTRIYAEGLMPDRRHGVDRRHGKGPAGVIVGLSVEAMQRLAAAWEQIE
jgi:hypothetical protein